MASRDRDATHRPGFFPSSQATCGGAGGLAFSPGARASLGLPFSARRPSIRSGLPAGARMKITDVRIRLFEYPMARPFHPTWEPFPHVAARMQVVEIHTDEGITGIGSGGVPVRWDVTARFLVGQDPFNLDQHVYNLRSSPDVPGPSRLRSGTSAGKPLVSPSTASWVAHTTACAPTPPRVNYAQLARRQDILSPHLDQRHRSRRQPPLRRREPPRPLHRVSLRPAQLDSRRTRLPLQGADHYRLRRVR